MRMLSERREGSLTDVSGSVAHHDKVANVRVCQAPGLQHAPSRAPYDDFRARGKAFRACSSTRRASRGRCWQIESWDAIMQKLREAAPICGR